MAKAAYANKINTIPASGRENICKEVRLGLLQILRNFLKTFWPKICIFDKLFVSL